MPGTTSVSQSAPRRRGLVVQLFVLAGSTLWILTGGPVHVLALLLAAAALSLALTLVDGEKRRNAALHATLERLSREVGVRASGQD